MLSFGEKKKETHEFFSKYNAITSKLKKRFLRKPNVSEISEQYCALAEECEKEGNPQYAALCWLNAAKCQGIMENKIEEIEVLIKAGRKFYEVENKNRAIGCPSPGQENIQAAINLFDHALELCEGQDNLKFVGAGLATELATALGPTPSGIQHLRRATDFCTFIPAVTKLVSYLIIEGDFVGALQTSTDLVDTIENKFGSNYSGYYRDILRRYEINKVLLLLILQPTPQNLSSSHAQLLEKYAWAEEEPSKKGPTLLNADEEILMQSLVLACQSKDYDALIEMEGDLWPYFDTEQKDLLRKLVETYCRI